MIQPTTNERSDLHLTWDYIGTSAFLLAPYPVTLSAPAPVTLLQSRRDGLSFLLLVSRLSVFLSLSVAVPLASANIQPSCVSRRAELPTASPEDHCRRFFEPLVSASSLICPQEFNQKIVRFSLLILLYFFLPSLPPSSFCSFLLPSLFFSFLCPLYFPYLVVLCHLSVLRLVAISSLRLFSTSCLLPTSVYLFLLVSTYPYSSFQTKLLHTLYRSYL